jgi:CheY-like chemotaxis protein
MTKQILDVGNCRPDHAAIRSLIEGAFDARVLQAHTAEEALAALQTGQFHLVLVNRQLHRDGSPGLALIKKIKSSPETASVPVMMITNFADQQKLALQAGAEPGFGKQDLRDAATLHKLAPLLDHPR